MKTLLKRIGIGVLLLFIIGVGGLLGFLYFANPAIGEAPEITIDKTPERVERGKYLAHHVNLCMDCHAIREWDKLTGPPKPGTEGSGGEIFNHDMGFPGEFISPNITPFALSDWTDGEIYRAITSGVNKSGDPLFPIMPWPHYGKMDKEDVYSIIAYIRTLDPIETTPVASKADFPLNFIMRTFPKEAVHESKPDPSDALAYGAYVTNAAGCYDCHTKQVKGEFVGKTFAGGMEFKMGPTSILRSANITPDPKFGIGKMSKEMFIQRFKVYGENFTPTPVGENGYQTVMPWMMYAGMSESDLGAIYDYLMSLEPVEEEVVKYETTAMK